MGQHSMTDRDLISSVPIMSQGTPVHGEAVSGTDVICVIMDGLDDEAEDTGIQTGGDSKFFGMSASLDSFSSEEKELIIQYQAKYEKDMECGGAYRKIGPEMSDPSPYGDPTVYK